MTTARADRREPRLEHHPTIPKAPPVDLAPHPPPSWSSSRWGLIPWVVLGAQCPQREETRMCAYAWGILRSSAVVAGVSRWRRRSPGRPVANLRERSRSSPQEEVQNDRPDDGDEEHESYRDEYRHVVGPPRERPRNAIDPELGEAQRTQPEDRQDDRSYEQNLARSLHETRLPARPAMEPTGLDIRSLPPRCARELGPRRPASRRERARLFSRARARTRTRRIIPGRRPARVISDRWRPPTRRVGG